MNAKWKVTTLVTLSCWLGVVSVASGRRPVVTATCPPSTSGRPALQRGQALLRQADEESEAILSAAACFAEDCAAGRLSLLELYESRKGRLPLFNAVNACFAEACHDLAKKPTSSSEALRYCQIASDSYRTGDGLTKNLIFAEEMLWSLTCVDKSTPACERHIQFRFDTNRISEQGKLTLLGCLNDVGRCNELGRYATSVESPAQLLSLGCGKDERWGCEAVVHYGMLKENLLVAGRAAALLCSVNAPSTGGDPCLRWPTLLTREPTGFDSPSFIQRDEAFALYLERQACQRGVDGAGTYSFADRCAVASAHEKAVLQKALTNQAECDAGDGKACVMAGLARIMVDTEPMRAVPYFRKACSLKVMSGCYQLGLILEKRGRVQSIRDLFVQGCEAGFAPACTHLGLQEKADAEKEKSDQKPQGNLSVRAENHFKAGCSFGDPAACALAPFGGFQLALAGQQ